MGGKSSKAKKEPSVSNVKNASGGGVGGDQQLKSSKDNLSSQSNSTTNSPKLKKKSIKRKLTKAFSRKSNKIDPSETAKAPDNTYASSITTTLKRTNTTGSLPPPKSISISDSRPNVPVIHRSDTLTLTTPVAPITPRDFKAPTQPPVDVSNSEDGTNEDEQNEAQEANEGAPPAGLYSQSEGGNGRIVALPKRMSKAYAFHLQIASKEIGERGAELQRIIQSEKPICDVYEDNPFKKGWCRLCKHPKNVHRDPYSDIMNELEEDFY